MNRRDREEMSKESWNKNYLRTALTLMRAFCGRQRNSLHKVIQWAVKNETQVQSNFQSHDFHLYALQNALYKKEVGSQVIRVKPGSPGTVSAAV